MITLQTKNQEAWMSLNTKLFRIILLIIILSFKTFKLMSMSYDEAKNRCQNSIQNIKEIVANNSKNYNKNTSNILKSLIPILEVSITSMEKKRDSNWIEEYFHCQDSLHAINWLLKHYENLTSIQQDKSEEIISPNVIKKGQGTQEKKRAITFLPHNLKNPRIVSLSGKKTIIKKNIKNPQTNQKIKRHKTPLKKKF
jgi:hypothetical protein